MNASCHPKNIGNQKLDRELTLLALDLYHKLLCYAEECKFIGNKNEARKAKYEADTLEDSIGCSVWHVYIGADRVLSQFFPHEMHFLANKVVNYIIKNN